MSVVKNIDGGLSMTESRTVTLSLDDLLLNSSDLVDIRYSLDNIQNLVTGVLEEFNNDGESSDLLNRSRVALKIVDDLTTRTGKEIDRLFDKGDSWRKS